MACPCFSVFVAILIVILLYFLKKYFSGTSYNSTKRLDGKTVIITGATAGIGKETALDLANRGANIILAVRNLEKAKGVIREIQEMTGNDQVKAMKLDLVSLKSVSDFAKEFLSEEDRLDILINNAGVILQDKSRTEDGYDVTFQANYLGHFLLTLLLLDILKKSAPSRILNISSIAAKHHTKINFSDINFENNFSSNSVYGQSKLAQVMTTQKLAKLLRGQDVSVFSLHPGLVRSDFLEHIPKYTVKYVLASILHFALLLYGKNVKQGTQTTIYCALEDGIEKYSGGYFAECQREKLPVHATDDAEIEKLWNLSLDMVKGFYH